MRPVTVHAVASGVYSDYRVHAVFADKADAEASIAVAKTIDGWRAGGDYFVESMWLYPKGLVAKVVTTYRCQADLWDDGSVEDSLRLQSVARPLDQLRIPDESTEIEFDTLHGPPTARPKVRFVRAPIHKGKGGRLEVRGSDRAAVIKAFNDRVMQHIAQPPKPPHTAA